MQDQGGGRARGRRADLPRNRAAAPGGSPSSSSFWPRSSCGWPSSPSATPIASRPAGTTFSLDGRWDASPDPSPWGRASVLPPTCPRAPAPGRRRSIRTFWRGCSSCAEFTAALSAWVILTFNSIFSALTCLTLYRIAEKNLRNFGGASHGLDLGTVSLRDLLAGAGGLGDEPECVPVKLGFVDDASHGRQGIAAHSRLDRVLACSGA